MDIEDFCHTLHKLKSVTKSWIKVKTASIDSASSRLKIAIESFLSGPSNGILTRELTLHLSHLSVERQRILDHLQLTSQLKSRTKWALQGDSKTKFFHVVASGRRLQNMVWSLEYSDGNLIEEEIPLKEFGKAYFEIIYKEDGCTSLEHQLKVVSLFPRMIPSEHSSLLSCPVSLKEIELSLKYFKKYRSPGPDGWPVEFYMHIFDLLGPVLLKTIDLTRTSGFIPPSLNSTFPALIPKKDNH